MDNLDASIRAMAANHGHPNIPDTTVKAIKQALACVYIDSVLDGRPMSDKTAAPIRGIDTDEGVEDDDPDASGDDLVSDDESEDATDAKSEKVQKMDSTKQLSTTDRPTIPTNSPNAWGRSSMGQVG